MVNVYLSSATSFINNYSSTVRILQCSAFYKFLFLVDRVLISLEWMFLLMRVITRKQYAESILAFLGQRKIFW